MATEKMDPSGSAPDAIPKFRWSPLFARRSVSQEDANGSKELYPGCNAADWLRSCSEEITSPVEGVSSGTIPKWLNGSLLRNGPGSLQVGNSSSDYLFDSSALLHRFAIENGRVTYQNRFLKSQTFLRNVAAQRIVLTESGTRAVPDPCQSIFQRVSAFFKPMERLSDNALQTIYPFGDEYYAFTETPVIHRIDPSSLETLDRVNVSNHVSIVNHSSHPHVAPDGTVYNLGLTVTASGPAYAIVKFSSTRGDGIEDTSNMFAKATIVGKVPARWFFHPGYMHTFGITENYFVIVEQPLSISVPAVVKHLITNSPLPATFRWYPEEQTQFYLLCRKTGQIAYQFMADAFCYFHIINSYEEGDFVVVDICCYRDSCILDNMYVETLKGIQKNPNYARMTQSRPLRFVLPLESRAAKGKGDTKVQNLVTLKGSEATAHRLSSSDRIFVNPELLCSLGCETPRFNYERHGGRPYRFFYAISADVDLDNPGMLIKVDTYTRTSKTWCEKNMFPSEPVFVPAPDPVAEDDGVVLSALLWGEGNENKVTLLVLDAASWTELGRTEFTTPGPVPKCFHGWFAKES